MADNPTNPRPDSHRPGHHKHAAPDAASLVEVYHCDSDLVANIVIDEVLRPAGIFAARHDRRSHAIVAPASMPGQLGIAVPTEQAAAARKRLASARRDGVLLDGEVVGEEHT
jgi:hypothetical protein